MPESLSNREVAKEQKKDSELKQLIYSKYDLMEVFFKD